MAGTAASTEVHNDRLEETNWSLQEVLEELRTAEEALIQQNIYLEQERQKYHDLFNFAPDGYLVTNPSGVIQSANQAVSNLLGMRQSDLIDKPLIVFIVQQDYSLFYHQLDRQSSPPVGVASALENRQQTWEINLQPRKSNAFPAEVTVSPIYENSDTITGLRWLIRDISERKQAELEREQAAQVLAQLNQELEQRVAERTTALQKSESRYRALMDGASDAIVLLDAQGNFIEGNQTLEKLLGYSQAELRHLHMSDIHPPTELAAARERFHDVVRHEIAPLLKSIVLRKDGSQVPVEITGTWIEVDGVQIVQAIFRNITERQQAELALQESQHFIEQIAQASPNILYLYDIQSERNVYANREISTVLGYTPVEIQAMGASLFQNLIHPDDLTIIPAEYARIAAAQDGDILEFEYRMKRANGEWCWLLSRNSIFRRDSQGRVLQTIGTAQDITAQKAALLELQEYQQRLERSNVELVRATRLKDEFLANMSHELRTPLNAILGLSEGLQGGMLGSIDKRQQKAIATIERSGQHLLSLINDVLEVSKIAAGKLELDITAVAITDLCKSSLVFVKEQAFKKQIQLTTIFAPNLVKIDVDERRIRQVIINLLTNGVKFTPMGGQVTLELQIEDSIATHPGAVSAANAWILLSVKDTGIGIAPENQSKLFQPFIQIDSSLNRQYGGTGLGLMLVKQIVELHGGSVSVASEFGRGSCFTVRLPYHVSGEHQTDTAAAIDLSSNPISLAEPLPWSIDDAETAVKSPLILLAEDNQDNIFMFSSYLGACNYRLIFAENGQEAIDLAQTLLPDLILMDIQMPGIDGLEAIETIRQNPRLAQTPIVVLTALAMNSDREKCLAAGANEYLAKPFRMTQLRTTIQQLLSRSDFDE